MADENFPRPALEVLRKAGFDVAWISEGQSGATDEQVLARSAAEGRTLLTFDKDFGELAFRRGLPAECFSPGASDPSRSDDDCSRGHQIPSDLGRPLQRSDAGKNPNDPVASEALSATAAQQAVS